MEENVQDFCLKIFSIVKGREKCFKESFFVSLNWCLSKWTTINNNDNKFSQTISAYKFAQQN